MGGVGGGAKAMTQNKFLFCVMAKLFPRQWITTGSKAMTQNGAPSCVMAKLGTTQEAEVGGGEEGWGRSGSGGVGEQDVVE